ncbi:hypothetical protein NFJ02_03g101120 [Pycnococcus provasolii]
MKEHCECELAWCRVLLQQEKENIGSQLTFHQLPTTDEVRAREWLHVLVPSTRKCMEKRQAYLKKKSRNCPRFASHHFPHHCWRFKRAEDFSRHSTRRDRTGAIRDALPCSLRWTPPPIGRQRHARRGPRAAGVRTAKTFQQVTLVKRIKALTGMPNLAVFMAWFDLFNLEVWRADLGHHVHALPVVLNANVHEGAQHMVLRIDDYLLTLMICAPDYRSSSCLSLRRL